MVKKKKEKAFDDVGAKDAKENSPPTTNTTCVANDTVTKGNNMMLKVGDVVEIHGLQGAKELNGRRGRVVKYVEETQRYGVKLEGEEETKAVKPANLHKLDGVELKGPAGAGATLSQRARLESDLADVVDRLKKAEPEQRGLLQKELAELVHRVKQLDDAEAKAAAKALASSKAAAAVAQARAKAKPMAAEPILIPPPPLPKEQHHPLPPRPKEPKPEVREREREVRPAPVSQREKAQPTKPPQLPERPVGSTKVDKMVMEEYEDEHEYPDPDRAYQSGRVIAGALVCGIITSQAELCPATWFVWSFLAVHLVGIIFLTDYAREGGLLALCATFGLHIGVALSELLLWILNKDGDDSLGPWSIVMLFASILYLHGFLTECLILPPDYITSISLFFPMFPAFNAAVAMSCLELFLEWRYFPEYKIFVPAVVVGALLMGVGQYLIWAACQTAHRNFWASCRNMPEEEEKPEDFVGLEIPDRKVVQDGLYRWERHPAYLGAMLWGVGAEVALCNPIMLFIVGFVVWASLLYITLEEEQELYDEFKSGYANYCALTPCWIPLFNSFLENAAFQREMQDNAEEQEDLDEDCDAEDGSDLDDCEDDVQSEDDLLPTWEGVPKGGALWNRQFRDPWMLG